MADRLHLMILKQFMSVRFPPPPPPLYTMRKTLLISLLATVTKTTARLHARAPIDEATLAKLRINAITSSQRRYVSYPLSVYPTLTCRRI